MTAATQAGVLTQAVLDTYSLNLLHAALPRMRWMQFATIREDLRKQPGENLIFTKLNDLTGDPAIAETSTISEDALTASTVTISVSEYAQGISVTEKLLKLGFFDTLAAAAQKLGRHSSVWGPDRLLMTEAMTGATTTLYGGGQASRAAVTAADTIDIGLIRDAVETLDNFDTPMFRSPDGDEFYVGMINPRQARYLREDTEWQAAQNYHATERPFYGEVGRFENVVFFQSTANFKGGVAATHPAFLDVNADTNNDLTSGIAGNQVDLQMACIFGDAYYGFASASPVEMRDNGVVDYGRHHGLAWYSIYGGGVLHANYGVVLETA